MSVCCWVWVCAVLLKQDNFPPVDYIVICVGSSSCLRHIANKFDVIICFCTSGSVD
jgi:hypothetical protein